MSDTPRSILVLTISDSIHAGEREDKAGTLAAATASGVDLSALATTLQIEGRDSFNKSWADLLAKISAKREALAAAR